MVLCAWSTNALATGKATSKLHKSNCVEDGQSLQDDFEMTPLGGVEVDLEIERDALGALNGRKEAMAILPCSFAESGRFGAICPDAGIFVVVDSGVVLCQVPLSFLRQDAPTQKIRSEQHNVASNVFEGNAATGDLHSKTLRNPVGIVAAQLPRYWDKNQIPQAELAHAPAVPPA